MAISKKPQKSKYEYVEANQSYRKRVKGPDGKFVALYGKTAGELTAKIRQFKEEMKNRPDPNDPLVNDYIDQWFRLNTGGLTEETQTSYKRVIELHIKPFTEEKTMSEIYKNDIKTIVAAVADKSDTLHNTTFMLLKRIFTSAFDNGLIEENPCPVMHNGGNEAPERSALNDDQVNILMNAIKDCPPYLFCMIGLYAGLRTEEILGLKWDCVHLDEPPHIDVRRASRFKGSKPVVTDRLKSKAARRTIPIPNQLTDCLKAEKANSTSDFVIHAPNGDPLSKTQLRRMWTYIERRRAKERIYYRYADGKKTAFKVEAKLGTKAKRGGYTYCLDFDVTPHILRHTYITNLLLGGVDIKTVQYLAGHEKSKTTLEIYSHLTYNRPEELHAKINAAF